MRSTNPFFFLLGFVLAGAAVFASHDEPPAGARSAARPFSVRSSAIRQQVVAVRPGHLSQGAFPAGTIVEPAPFAPRIGHQP